MVLNPSSKSTPIRCVFNSSQKYRGYSLNSSWDLGPDMTGNLHGILMRFRENLIAAQGDIKKMYYAVRVTKEEEMMQLYIWKFTGEDNIRIFAMSRLVMGNKPSANCSQIALKETAYLNNNDINYPKAKLALTEDSYVDNTFTMANNIEDLKKNIEEIEIVAKEGGFNYKPWIIGGQSISQEHPLPTRTQELETSQEEKALGIHWNVEQDNLFIKGESISKNKSCAPFINFQENPKLKLSLRCCLSLHSKPYDPLGLILPIKMNGNILFRQTLQFLSTTKRSKPKTKTNNLPWDEEITEPLKEKWLSYFSMLDAASEITFQRATRPHNIDEEIKPDIVTFNDGNENAYGAVSYSRWTLKDGTKVVNLLAAKAKLGPLLDKGDVVKMELSGATMAVRLKSWIVKHTRTVYGTHQPFLDSKIVQDMIKKESYTLNTFAGLRVKEIASKSDVTSWMHISSKDNYVADILTRGTTPDKLKKDSEWQVGPSWLKCDIDSWPINNNPSTKEERETIKSFEKVRTCKSKLLIQATDNTLENPYEQLIENRTCVHKIVKVIAYTLRWKPRKGIEHYGEITAQEFDEAFKILIHIEQRKLNRSKFKGLNLIEKEVMLPSGRKLKFITVNSRVKNFNVHFGNQEDTIFALPGTTLSKRIAKNAHDKYHRDVDTTVMHIRKEFWIPGLRKIVSTIDRHCKICLISRQKVARQMMGDMPEWISPLNGPFSHVSMDQFGPIMIKDSVVKRGPRCKKKVWGVLFVCASSRAVYLDVADDYGTEAILHCIRRLQADRGNIRLIVSDPGTQLQGASKELMEVRDGWNKEELIRFGSTKGLEWKFTMAASPHQNGVTEVMVKMVKGIIDSLTQAIGTTVLHLNELFTLMKEVASLTNERPIGLKPNLQTDPQFLSPNSLLLGRCSDRMNAGPFQNKSDYENDPDSDRTRYLLIQKITNQFWTTWQKVYFPTLLTRQKWHHEERNLCVGDVCMMKDSNSLRGEWKICRVGKVFPDVHGKVRNVMVYVPPPSLSASRIYPKKVVMNELRHHVSNLIVIVPSEDTYKYDCEVVKQAIGGECAVEDELHEPVGAIVHH